MDSVLNNISVFNKSLGGLFKILVVILILSTFFLFTNLTTDFYDTPKFLSLLFFVCLVFVLTSLRFTLSDKVTLVRTPLDLPVLLLLAVGIISTLLSASPYISLLGNQVKVNGSLVSLITLVLTYLLFVNNLRGRDIKQVIYLLIGSGVVLSIISLLAYFGVTLLPKPWAHGINFTPTGSNFTTSAVLVLLLPFLLIEILKNSNLSLKIISIVILTLFGVTIGLTGTLATYVASIAALALTIFIARPKISPQEKSLPLIAASLVVVALILVLSFVPPLGNSNNPLYNQAKNFPQSPQLSFPLSWKVSVSAFRDSPFWGTGPGTYLFDFTSYKPIEFNSTTFWNIRFDESFNEYLNVLATLGGIGLVALLSLTALFISSAFKTLTSSFSHTSFDSDQKLAVSLAISGLVFFIVLALHTSTLVLWVVGLLVLASFMVLNVQSSNHEDEYIKRQGGFRQILLRVAQTATPSSTSQEVVKIEALPSILLIVSIIFLGFAFFFAGKFALADYHHRLALNAITQNDGILAYNELVAAERLNSFSDLYRIDLAQTNFALANAIAVAKGPTEASPSGSLTDQDKQNIQILLQQAINEGRTAVSLSPRSAINWEILGALYRQIAGVAQNALLFSLDSYGRAILNDPLNPLLRLNVGGTYYAVRNYDLAIRFFTDAVNLKPDFANGYYNLSVALRDKGDLQSALIAAERVVALVDANSQDYKVASDYLNDLRARSSENKPTEESKVQQPPAAETQGALQEENLPKVLDLPKPDKIATPPAVKKPGETPEPSPAP